MSYAKDQRLLSAISEGDDNSFQQALESGADVNADDGMPLLLAVQAKRYDYAKELHDRGACIYKAMARAFDKQSRHALDLSIDKKNAKAQLAVQEADATIERLQTYALIFDNPAASATQMLLIAIPLGNAARLREALKNGADVDTEDGLPLLLAAKHRRYDFAKMLHDKEANIHLSLAKAETEKNGHWRNRHNDERNKQAHLALENEAQATITLLSNYAKGLEDRARTRQTKALRKLATGVGDLQAAMAEILQPRDLQKSSLPFPPSKKHGLG